MDNIVGDKIKKSWDEVTVAEFFTLESIEKAKHLSGQEKHIQILSVLSGIKPEEFKSCKYDDIKAYFEKELAFLKEEVSGEMKEYYHVNGKKYKLIRQISDLTAGQFVDFMKYTEEKDDVLEKIHVILTVFLIPVKELKSKEVIANKLRGLFTRTRVGERICSKLYWHHIEGIPENYLDTSAEITSLEIYDFMSITDCMSIMVFFCNLRAIFSIYIVRYLEDLKVKKLASALRTLKQEQNPNQEAIERLESLIVIMLNGHGSLQLTA